MTSFIYFLETGNSCTHSPTDADN